MRLVFAGTPEFSVPALDALHAAGHAIVGVYTQPDRPAGRGRKLTPSPVAERATALGLPVFKPEKLRGNEQALAELRGLSPDVMVVVAYGLILPQAVLDIPRHGCLNIHASLLPRWRGAAPLQRAILAGDAETGVTIMQMDAGLDTGPMLLKEAVPITPETTAADLHDALAALGGRLIAQALARLERGDLPPTPQPADGATYAGKLTKEEAQLDWSSDAAALVRAIHAYNPAPGAWSELGGERVKLLRAEAGLGTSGPLGVEPGTIVRAADDGLVVATGAGLLRVRELQRPGGRPAGALAAFGGKAPVGAKFSAPPRS
ncbi:MAG TPA: methionyl-tRNA formyltransferase [Nevskiaceae bacterium]|nr:methionyl-tRNA formyltransferase [Nevskiaceae bacterium]